MNIFYSPVKWGPIFHLVADFQLPVLHVSCQTWKLMLVSLGSRYILMSQGFQHLQRDTQYQLKKSCMSFGYIPWRRRRMFQTSSIFGCNFMIVFCFINLVFLFLFFIQIWSGACFTGNQSCSLFDINSGNFPHGLPKITYYVLIKLCH